MTIVIQNFDQNLAKTLCLGAIVILSFLENLKIFEKVLKIFDLQVS
jgi:hypothetical protein